MTCEQVNDRLLEFIEGETPPKQAASIRAHLEQCRACAARYRAARQLVGDLSAARSVEHRDGNWDAGDSRRPAPRAGAAPLAIGDFEILEEIGRGGMGVVYRARQKSLNRIVALKVLSAGLPRSERTIRRFHQEAQAAARLHHTNIVPIYAQGHEAGHYYYAMELIDGQSLDKVLADDPHLLRLTPAPAPPREAATEVLPSPAAGPPPEPASRPAGDERAGRTPASLIRSSISSILHRGAARGQRRSGDYKRIARLLAEVAEALHHAHEQGVVHRDIKPQNLLLGHDDKLHITDFGLARLLDEPGLTLSTEMVGTPAYMAPEQITGGGKAIDRRTDVYALGVTLYELLTLTRPFQGQTYDQVITQVLKREPKAPRRLDAHIPIDLETICTRAMEKEPRRRFPAAAEMARDLRRYAEDFPIASRRVGPLGRAVRWVRRRPALAGAIAAVTALIVLVPLLLGIARAYADEGINGAWEILLEDYREKDRALAQLNWASALLGDRYRREMVRAFAHIRTEPERTAELAAAILRRRPQDPDARCLLAWAYRRRMQRESDAMWVKARAQIERVRALDTEPGAAGYFFLAQAVGATDPEEAQRIFDKAIDRRRQPFFQAMLHQARAMNQIMYLRRDPGYYQKAVGRLESVIAAAPNKAYPHYLLSITHLLAAEIYADEGRREESQKAYARSLEAAAQAQAAQPASPRGYAAEAGCLESQGDLRGALAAWKRIRAPVQVSPSDAMERDAYSMRLYFWLGDYENAERARRSRYRRHGTDDEDTCYDPDAEFYAALIAASAGDRSAAERALAAGVRRAGAHAEPLLLLDAAYRLIGIAVPRGLWEHELDFRTRLPPGWTPAWLKALVDCQRGALPWDALPALANEQTSGRESRQLLLAGADFFRGLAELAAGRREPARAALRAAWQRYDNENYCFRAKMILLKLERDPAWPAWLK